MSKMRLLDLFCCAGGASMGYHLAGFEVIGVDHKPQPNYPFQFFQHDAVDFMKRWGREYDFIHASPPCQGYSNHTKEDSEYVNHSKGKDEPRLIQTIRELIPGDTPYVIENVIGAKKELIKPFQLCGVMFGLPFARHRLFESNLNIIPPHHPNCKGIAKQYALENNIDYRDMSITGKSRRSGCIDTWKELMQMPWAGRAWEVTEAIPHVYAKYIGEQVLKNMTT